MSKEETTPSESEWMIMEIFWESNKPLTSLEVIKKLQGYSNMTAKMTRVLINRLCQKGILDYIMDKKDARLYHYFAIRSKEECLKEKSKKFVDSYFKGSQTSAVAALLKNVTLTEQQIKELEEILEKTKTNRKKGKK